MRYKLFIVLFVSMFLLQSGCAFGAKEEIAGSKIAVVNLQKIMIESSAGKAAREDFAKDMEAKTAQLKQTEDKVRALEAELAPDKQLKPEVRMAKETDYRKLAREYTRLKEDLEDELKVRDNELTANLVRTAIDVTQKLAKEKVYTLIMQTSPQIVYVDGAADITQEVLDRMDNQ